MMMNPSGWLQEARKLIGTPYEELDSGQFVAAVLNRTGLNPADDAQWSEDLTELVSQVHDIVPVVQAQPGDLLFWGVENLPYHVGIYIGGNQFISATQAGDKARIQSIKKIWYPNFAGVVR